MGKLKKVGIGFGVIIGLFFALVIAAGVSSEVEKANMTPEERQLWEEERAAKALQKEIDEKKELEDQKLWEIRKALQAKQALEEYEARSIEEENLETVKKQKEEAKLSDEDLQTLIVGFESYNKSVKILLDACANVESENDFRLLGQLIVEYGEDFVETTSGYGAVRDKLIAEGYGEHPVLGPLMNQSLTLVNLMSTCMEILAWEFSG